MGLFVGIVLSLLCVGVLAKELRGRSIYPEGTPVFDPLHPEQHATWKGKFTMPREEATQLCYDVATYMGIAKDNVARFLLEIAAAESDFGYYVRQVRGPAQSVWQIEPATARDCHERLSKRNPLLYKKILSLRDPNLDEEENVVTNLAYGGALCVGILFLKGIHFDELDTVQKRAMAWKKYYNTYLGKGTLEGYCQKVARHLGTKVEGAFPAEASFDPALLSLPNVFQERDNERYLTLPDDFDESPMGKYYKKILQEKPKVFEEVPRAILQSKNVRAIMDTVTLELLRNVQKDPASIGQYRDMPPEILLPLAHEALRENALKSYPHLPPELQQDPDILKIYESQKFLRERLGL